MSLLKLRLTMVGTLALIVGASTLFFTILLSWSGVTDMYLLVGLVVAFNIAQWLLAPYLIDAMYGVRGVKEGELPELEEIVRRVSRRSGIRPPKLMLSNLQIPNAFAYGSPLTGKRVAVTRGLLSYLNKGEVEAVLGHEFGHLKHGDVQLMMFVSMLPAIFYYIAYSMMLSSWYGRERESGGGFAIGLLAMLFYWLLTLFVLGLSRLREYYADAHSAMVVEDGADKLSSALAKITLYSGRMRSRLPNSGFKTLFISDPDRAKEEAKALAGHGEELVKELKERRLTTWDRVMELLSTHPRTVKRIRALQALKGSG